MSIVGVEFFIFQNTIRTRQWPECYWESIVGTCKYELLHVSPKSGCSWGWMSVLWGRDLLAKGLKCKMGDGRKINTVFRDQWIPKYSCNLTIQSNAVSCFNDFKVRDLMDWHRYTWHKPLIHEVLFLVEVVPKILSICTPTT